MISIPILSCTCKEYTLPIKMSTILTFRRLPIIVASLNYQCSVFFASYTANTSETIICDDVTPKYAAAYFQNFQAPPSAFNFLAENHTVADGTCDLTDQIETSATKLIEHPLELDGFGGAKSLPSLIEQLMAHGQLENNARAVVTLVDYVCTHQAILSRSHYVCGQFIQLLKYIFSAYFKGKKVLVSTIRHAGYKLQCKTVIFL